MNNPESSPENIWRISPLGWALLAACAISLVALYYDGLARMVFRWGDSEEYGYGYIIPLLTAFFIWQRKAEIGSEQFRGSWTGVLIVIFGLFLYLLGELSTLYIIIQYSFLVTLYGVVIAIAGWRVFRIILAPLLLLVFMIPLPIFIYQGLSAQLQLISSDLGVAFIRLFGISVYLEGNIIDLGTYKLQVVEACSGLRYLFPLAALSYIAAYIFKAPFWMRAVVFLSSIPITIFMNSLRIGVIGILVDNWGIAQAEGFLHYFEGWIIFMACMVILILEIWVLTKISNKNHTMSDSFELDFPEPTSKDAIVNRHKMHFPQAVVVLLVILSVPLSALTGQRQEIIPDRDVFAEFPLRIGDWKGSKNTLEQIYLDVLKLDDYIIADYKKNDNEQVSIYMAYYASQSKGESVHSPRSCIPGGGWQIKSLEQVELPDVTVNGVPVTVNRVVIRKGDTAQVVYYWFQGRSRIITNEYLVKWYLFWDSLTRSRTDGALVRLTAFVRPGTEISEIDGLLASFAKDISSMLPAYIPD